MEGVSPWQPLMQQWVKSPSGDRGCRNNGGFEKEAGEMSSPTVVLNEAEVLFDVRRGQLRMAPVSAVGNRHCPAPLCHHLTVQRCSGSSTLYAATCLARYSSALQILSSGSFTLFPISAYTGQSL